MVLTGQVDWHCEKFNRQVFVSPLVFGGEVDFFISTEKIKSKENWGGEEEKMRGNIQSLFILLEQKRLVMQSKMRGLARKNL